MMMSQRDKIVKYCSDRFLKEYNTVVKREDLAMVFKFEDDYFQLVGTETDFGVSIGYTDQEDIAKAIHKQKPDIPLQTILEVLESHDDYHEKAFVQENEMDEMDKM